jgi:hypothetical protein
MPPTIETTAHCTALLLFGSVSKFAKQKEREGENFTTKTFKTKMPGG